MGEVPAAHETTGHHPRVNPRPPETQDLSENCRGAAGRHGWGAGQAELAGRTRVPGMRFKKDEARALKDPMQTK